MTNRAHPALFSIPPHRAFSDALVEGLLAQHGGDWQALVTGIILVPNNRAGMAIQDAFVRQSEKGLLLPRLVPVGDADLGEHVGAALDPFDLEPIPPAIYPLRRQMILARKLQLSSAMGALNAAQAMRLAADLGRVIDQLIVEKKTVQDLRGVDVGSLTSHWEDSLRLLSVILDDWPTELARLGCIDLSERRNRQLDRVAERWRSNPPPGFVVAAGISTSARAIADLLRVVARMERGSVVLDGVDFAMPDAQWDAIVGDEREPPIETHPQYHLRFLLDRIGATRDEVEPWQWGGDSKALASRALAISHGMAPAEFTQGWSKLPDATRKLSGVSAFELATPAQEAQTVALALRKALDKPGKTVALITPDRALARRVSAHLKRWGVDADDSAGVALSVTLPGTLILTLADAVAEEFAPAPLLALLKHPLVQAGEGRLAWLDGARKLDLALRGPRPGPGIAGIDAVLADRNVRTAAVRGNAAEWWDSVKGLLSSGAEGSQLSILRAVAEALAGDGVWSGPEGRALADLFAALEDGAGEGPEAITMDVLRHLLRDLMDGIAVRPARGGHPRLFIWGLIEAKLQSADFVILAGLNEGVWPALANPDPWLAPAVRRLLGLPGLERRIGLSAHDLAGACGAERVLLTRAKRDTASPTIASRFWLRLETLCGGFDKPEIRFDLLAQAIDHAEGERAKQPAPCPPMDERPRRISVTEVDGLKADPYTFYAKKMLKLSALDAPGEEPDARWRGTFLHQVLGDWGQKDDFAAGALVPRLQVAFDASGLHPVVRAMWQPRFEEAAEFFEARVADGRKAGREPLKAEIKGSKEFSGIMLTGQSDRIDQLPEGKLGIIDYKTGEAPSDKQVVAGMRLQLGLLGLLAECGAFEGVAGTATAFEYWSQARDGEKGYGKVKSPASSKSSTKMDPDSFVEDIHRHFEAAVDKWLFGNAPFKAKLHPDLAYSEFDQLMRYEEWRGRSG